MIEYKWEKNFLIFIYHSVEVTNKKKQKLLYNLMGNFCLQEDFFQFFFHFFQVFFWLFEFLFFLLHKKNVMHGDDDVINKTLVDMYDR